MNGAPFRNPVIAAAATLMLAGSSGAFAYDEDSAIRDCEKRLRSEYDLNDGGICQVSAEQTVAAVKTKQHEKK